MNAFKTSLIATALCLGMGAAPVFADAAKAERSAGQAIEDSTITGSVKTRLLGDTRTKGFDVNVDTYNGVVTLRGGADSQAAKEAAAQLAAGVKGVTRVDNQLTVAAADSKARQEANTATASGKTRDTADSAGDSVDDGWITSKVKSQLLADSAVKGSQINVDTKGNVVTLTGVVDSQSAKDAAVRIAAGTKGVRSVVATNLHVKQ